LMSNNIAGRPGAAVDAPGSAPSRPPASAPAPPPPPPPPPPPSTSRARRRLGRGFAAVLFASRARVANGDDWGPLPAVCDAACSTGELPTASTTQVDFATGYSNNQDYTGTIPTQYGLLSQVTLMNFHSNNAITGTLPSELGLLTAMSTGNPDGDYRGFIRETTIGGTIPTELGHWVNMQSVLCMAYTEIAGPIPSQLGNMANMGSRFLLDFAYGRERASGAMPRRAAPRHAIPYRPCYAKFARPHEPPFTRMSVFRLRHPQLSKLNDPDPTREAEKDDISISGIPSLGLNFELNYPRDY